MKRKIVDFHQDDVGDWVADLECGHGQHVRHNPPLSNWPWVLSAKGRRRFIGYELVCKHCQRADHEDDDPENGEAMTDVQVGQPDHGAQRGQDG